MNESLKNRIQSLQPIIDENSEILILGTMPGKESLESEEYYASPNNSFWKIVKQLFNSNMEFKDYEEKIPCLKKHHIALWDTLHTCTRESSLDSDIKEEEYNNIDGLLARYPKIKKIVFNGKKATNYYKPQLPSCIACSTSNAFAKKIEEKIKIWESALNIKYQKNIMKSKKEFNSEEVCKIKELIRLKLQASNIEQKGIRAKIRKIGFFWEDFHPKTEKTKVEYNVENFEKLIKDGSITIRE